jgi:hypothetical protein
LLNKVALSVQVNMKASRHPGPQEGTWAPGYYSVLFKDPDGIRLEANFVPGAGVLEPGVSLNPTAGYAGRDQD